MHKPPSFRLFLPHDFVICATQKNNRKKGNKVKNEAGDRMEYGGASIGRDNPKGGCRSVRLEAVEGRGGGRVCTCVYVWPETRRIVDGASAQRHRRRLHLSVGLPPDLSREGAVGGRGVSVCECFRLPLSEAPPPPRRQSAELLSLRQQVRSVFDVNDTAVQERSHLSRLQRMRSLEAQTFSPSCHTHIHTHTHVNEHSIALGLTRNRKQFSTAALSFVVHRT